MSLFFLHFFDSKNEKSPLIRPVLAVYFQYFLDSYRKAPFLAAIVS